MKIEEARAVMQGALPGWTVVWEGGRLLYRAAAPNYAETGLVVEGCNVEDVVARVRAVEERLSGEASAPIEKGIPTNGGGKPIMGTLPADPDDTAEQVRRTVSRSLTRSDAVSQGFTGETCVRCGSMEMQKTGTCSTCVACGTTSGCS